MYKKLKFLMYFFVFSASFTFLIILLLYNTNANENMSATVYRRLVYKGKTDLTKYPMPWILIDIEFQYLINNLVCQSNEKNPNTHNASYSSETPRSAIFMLILITSHAGDVETREKIRQILPQNELDRIKMKRIFLLAKPPLKSSKSKYRFVQMEEIQYENNQFRDILMGNFEESYHNLTYKHLMGLEWASRYCSQANFILKQDDDVIVDFYQLSTFLLQKDVWNLLVENKTIFGKILSNYTVIRDLKSKWFVPKEEFKEDRYPAFVSGWAYITTPKVVKDLVKIASQFRYFWIDDVHITGTLREAVNVELIDLHTYFTIYKGQLQCCISTSAYSMSKSNQPYWCDFVVGPSNDDLQLMEIFQNHSRFCHTTKLCLRRAANESLNSTCVITEKMVVNNFSNTRKNKTHGMWKSIKL